MLERGHRSFGRIGKRSQRSGGRDRAMIVCLVGSVRHIAIRTVAGGQPPGVRAVTRKVFWVRNRIGAVDQRNVAVVIEIGTGEISPLFAPPNSAC